MNFDARPLPAELAVDSEPYDDTALDSVAEGEEDGRGEWQITDLGSAEWAMRKVAEIAAEQTAMAEQAADWHARIHAWLKSGNDRMANRRSFLEAKLIDYQRSRREADPKAKTLFLPSGQVASSGRKATVSVENPGAYTAWAIDGAPDTLFVEHKVMAMKVKNRFGVALLPVIYDCHLDCGHVVTVPYSSQPDVGLIIDCLDCSDGASEGPGVVSCAVVKVEPGDERWTTVDDQGEIVSVPGLVAVPPEVTYRVSPNP